MKTSGVMSVFLALALLSGCDSYPRDIEGTSRRVADDHLLRVGYGTLDPTHRILAERYVARIAAANGARVEIHQGQSDEVLFASLDADHLDLVLTEVAKDSPWLTEVAVIEPLSRRRAGERELGLSAVARNGENRWVMQLEREARAMKGGG
jgi:hypothetical protein